MSAKQFLLGVSMLLIASYYAIGQTAEETGTKIFDHTGAEQNIDDILAASQGKKYIFFGELHGQAESHTLQLALLQQLYQKYGKRIVLGMEMFEADVQPVVDEYFGGLINQRSFESESRTWANYSDYRPIVEFAREHQLPLVATNIPRRYANAVYHKSVKILDSLSDYAKQFLPELPMQVDTTLNSYKAMREMVPGHAGENMLYSQAIKDATMAKYILQHSDAETIFLHLNGAYHSNDREGIISFMPGIAPDQILTITTILDEDLEIDNPATFQKADFTIISKKKEA